MCGPAHGDLAKRGFQALSKPVVESLLCGDELLIRRNQLMLLICATIIIEVPSNILSNVALREERLRVALDVRLQELRPAEVVFLARTLRASRRKKVKSSSQRA